MDEWIRGWVGLVLQTDRAPFWLQMRQMGEFQHEDLKGIKLWLEGIAASKLWLGNLHG